MLNPKLNVGDRVRLLHMEGETMRPGTWGTVTAVSHIFGDDQYSVSWDTGDKDNVGELISKLSLISSEDAWDLGKRKKLKESSDQGTFKYFQENKDFIKKFPNSSLSRIRKFLSAVRDSSVVNMFQSGFLLICGRERLEHFVKYENTNNKKALKYIIDNADSIRDEMIRLSLIYLESEDKEITTSSVSRTMDRLSSKFTVMYMNFPIADNSTEYQNIDVEDDEEEEYDEEDDY